MARVEAQSVSKRFTLRRDRADSVGKLLVRMLPGRRPPPPQPFWALQDVSFTMADGRSLGIIGHNGAGKSTLLKILTKTMAPTLGTVHVQGRISALIELGAGFHPDFTGRENIILNASILGVSRREVQRRMADIIEFSGIAPFIDTPVKYYSSGMHARLGFSVAIHVDPEILIVDEVLAVGDQSFSEQCMNRIFQMKRNGVGILLVTHSLDAVETLMDDAVWLDHGRVLARGRPRTVVHAYREHVATAQNGQPLEPEDGPFRQGGLEIGECRISSADGRDRVRSGDPLLIALPVRNLASEAQTVHFRLLLQRPDGLTVCEFSTKNTGTPLRLGPGLHMAQLRVEAAVLVPGTYDVALLVTDLLGTTLVEDHVVGTATIWSDASPLGLCILGCAWSTDGAEGAGG